MDVDMMCNVAVEVTDIVVEKVDVNAANVLLDLAFFSSRITPIKLLSDLRLEAFVFM
jgi:hypothetical protein